MTAHLPRIDPDEMVAHIRDSIASGELGGAAALVGGAAAAARHRHGAERQQQRSSQAVAVAAAVSARADGDARLRFFTSHPCAQ